MKFKENLIRIVLIVAICALSIGTVVNFSFQLHSALTNETYRTLNEVSEHYNKTFSDRIKYNIKTMNVLASGLERMRNQPRTEIIDVLQDAVDDGEFSKMAVCDATGMSFSNGGVSADVSQRSYFQKAMKGEINISDPFASLVNGEDTIVIAVPIYYENEVTGVLLGVYPLATAGTQLLDSTYYSDGYGFVISPDGGIILSSEHDDKLATEKNLFAFFEKAELIDYSVAEIKAAIEKGESNSFAFTYNGDVRYVSFMPSTVNDWYTFSVASDEMIMQQEKATKRVVFQLVFQLILVGVLIGVMIAMRNRRHNKEVLVANQKYQSLIAHINGGLIVASHAKIADEIIVDYVSVGFTDMTGYTLEDMKCIFKGRYLDMLLEEDRKEAFEKYLEQTKETNAYRMPYRIRKKDGSVIWVMDNGYLVKDADGWHNHSILTDITAMKQQEGKLRRSENRFSVAINASSGTLFEVDLRKQWYTHFENAERIFGIKAEKLLEDTRKFSTLSRDEFADAITNYFFHPDDRSIAKNAMKVLIENGKMSYEARLRRADNSYIWARIDLSVSMDEAGVPLYLVGYMSDIDNVKKHAELLESKVQTDSMTGLYNKVAMSIIAKKILGENPSGCHALIVLDIDNFKGINDTLGHAFGDVVLIEISAKLKTVFRGADIVGRMGGDEFAILMKNVSDTSHVLKKAAELSGIFRQTYAGEKGNYKISCSMGIIMTENNGDTFETLYRKADAALYKAKQDGKDRFVLYQESDAQNYPIESTRTDDEELQDLRAYHNTEEYIFELMYASDDFDASINRTLAAIGQQYRVSRVYIFENDESGRYTSNIYEWCSDGIAPKINDLQNLKIVSGTESILDCFDKNGLFYCNDVRELPPYSRKILESKGVLSTLQVTIANGENLYGLIGFDECSEYRVWTSEEIEKLSFLARVLSVFLFKKKAEVALLENLETRLKILDVLPDYICVVNPETHSIEYTNNKMKELLPNVHAGAFCFTALRGGQNAPCETCLVERIKRGDTDNLEIVSTDKKIHLKINALYINWTKDQRMVLLYGIIKEKNE
ncbi:MAG: diguanylate cyclase [Christensenellaceae bacterium]